MRVAAVVVTYNRLDHLRRTVARLLEEGVDHLLVVDNGSDDGSRDWLAVQDDPRLAVLLAAANGGGAQGFEDGLRAAVARFDPDWCVLMDDDARPRPGALAAFRARGHGRADAVAAAVTHPDGRICEMNRPWRNPFWHGRAFLGALGGGRGGFHVPDAALAPGADPLPVDGASFVGLFLSRAAVRRAGYPEGGLFIYGDDVLYTLALSRAGGRIVLDPAVAWEHDCTLADPGAVFRPLWKTYYLHRNRWFVYRAAAGPLLFWPLMAAMAWRWSRAGRRLPPEEGAVFRRLSRLALRDAARGRRHRPHAEIVALAAARPG